MEKKEKEVSEQIQSSFKDTHITSSTHIPRHTSKANILNGSSNQQYFLRKRAL